MAVSARPMEALSNTCIKQTAAERSSSSSSLLEKAHCKNVLPEDFTPTPYSVICGRGRKCTEAVGNRRLHVIATMFISRYAKASRKEEKSIIVSDILEIVRDACTNPSFSFVRYCEGRWWEVENINAREKIGTVLRDCLHSKYKSSTKSKLERRRQRKERKKQQQRLALQVTTPLDIMYNRPSTNHHHLLRGDDDDDDSSSVLSGEELEMDSIFS
jgi:hypothetical protein